MKNKAGETAGSSLATALEETSKANNLTRSKIAQDLEAQNMKGKADETALSNRTTAPEESSRPNVDVEPNPTYVAGWPYSEADLKYAERPPKLSRLPNPQSVVLKIMTAAEERVRVQKTTTSRTSVDGSQAAKAETAGRFADFMTGLGGPGRSRAETSAPPRKTKAMDDETAKALHRKEMMTRDGESAIVGENMGVLGPMKKAFTSPGGDALMKDLAKAREARVEGWRKTREERARGSKGKGGSDTAPEYEGGVGAMLDEI